MKLQWYWIVIFIPLMACSHPIDSTKSPFSLKPGITPTVEAQQDQTTAQRIESIIQQYPCSSNVNEPCAESTFTLSPQEEPKPDATAPKILMIDDGMYVRSLTLDRHRVLAHYQIDSNEVIQRFYPTIRLPSGLIHIAQYTSSLSPTWLYGLQVNRLNTLFTQTYHNRLMQRVPENSIEKDTNNHGDLSFGFLADQHSTAQFVLLHVVHRRGNLCGISTQEGRAQFRMRALQWAAQVRRLVDEHQIDYIHYSAGIDLQGLKDFWAAQRCSEPEPAYQDYVDTLRIYKERFDQIAEKAILFQSAGRAFQS